MREEQPAVRRARPADAADDRGGYFYRPIGSRMEGTANLYSPGRQRQLRDQFQQVWERSLPSPELRPLHI